MAEIFNQTKKVELRRRRPKRLMVGSVVFIYETTPTKLIVGAVNVSGIITNNRVVLWDVVGHRLTSNAPDIELEQFNNYFYGAKECTGILFESVYKYKKPISLNKLGINSVIQSFIYVSEEQFKILDQLRK